MLRSLLMLLTLCTPTSHAQAVSGAAVTPAVVPGVPGVMPGAAPGMVLAEPRDLPGYIARESRAQARLKASKRYQEGGTSLGVAYPHLRGGDWLDPAWLAGRVALLDAAGRARALEARAELSEPSVDSTLSRRERTRLGAARTRALDTEERADSLERRVLLSMQALLQAQPDLVRGELEGLLGELDQARAAAQALWRGADPASRPQRALELARLDQERAAFEGLAHDLVAVATQPGLVLELNTTGLADPLRAPWTARRLTLLLPLSDGLAHAPLLAWIEQETLRLSAAPPLDGTDSAALRAQLEQLTTHQGQDPVSLAWSALSELRRGRLQDCLDRSEQLSDQTQSDQAQEIAALEQADQARLDAERAVELATDSQARWVAQVLTSVSQDYDRAALYKADLEAQTQANAAQLRASQEQLDKLLAQVSVAQAMSSLGSDRDRRLGETYVSLRELVQTLRRAAIEADSDGKRRDTLAQRVEREAQASQAQLALDRAHAEALSTSQQGDVLYRLETWQEVIKAMHDIARLERSRALSHQAEVVQLLETAKTARRTLAIEVPSEVRLSDRSMLLEELKLELRVVIPRLLTLGRQRAGALREHLSSLPFWGGVAWGLLRLGLGVVLWRWLRERLPLLAERAVDLRSKDMRRLERVATEQLTEPLTLSLRALLDLVVVWLVLAPMERLFPEAGLALLIWWQYLLFTLLVQLYQLLVARYPSTRPALLHVTNAGWRLGERTLRIGAGWLIARQFASYLSLDLLNADALHTLLMAGFSITLVVLVLLLLHAWEPTLRALLAKQGGDDVIRSYLTSQPARPRLTRWIRAAVDIVLLSFAAIWRQVQFRASEGSALGRALNLFYRYSMSDKEEEGQDSPIDRDLQSKILAAHTPSGDHVLREDLDDQFYAALKAWQADSAQGTLALVGDRGSGMATWLNQISSEMAERGLGLRRMAMHERLNTRADVVRWVGEQLDLRGCEDLVAMEELLLSRPPTVFVVERCERAFLRRVGGFDAMRALFELVGRCGDRHFWVLGFHQPAWAYISRLDRLLKVHLFHHVLELAPMTEAQLHQLVVSRTKAAGYSVDFGELLRGGALSGDVDGELKRATTAFFRVLAEASHGNPAVALRLWVQSLRQGEPGEPGEPRMLRVRMGSALAEDLVEGLGETELFLLAAIRMQDTLNETELAAVNNMNATAVRSSVQVLRGRGLVETHKDQLRIPLRQQSTLTRTLRRRNLLDWRG